MLHSADRGVAPGDLLGIVIALRRLMTAHDSAGFALDRSLVPIDDQAETMSADLRPRVTAVANDISELLQYLEGLPQYRRLKEPK